MEIQNPFVIDFGPAFADQRDFSAFFFNQISHHHHNQPAIVELESPQKQWRYSELRATVNRCKQRLREIGVSAGCRLALITSTTCRVLFIHLACSELEATTVCINGWATPDEIWHQLDEVECRHAVVEVQFTSKVEELRRKALMRGLSRCKVVRTLDDVLGEGKLSRHNRESKTPHYHQVMPQEKLLCYWTTLKEGSRFLVYWLPDVETLGASDLLDRVYEIRMDKGDRQGLLKNLAMDMVESKWKRTFKEKGFRIEPLGKEDDKSEEYFMRLRYLAQSTQLSKVSHRDGQRRRNADLINRLMEEKDVLATAVIEKDDSCRQANSPKTSPEDVTLGVALQINRRKRGKATGVQFDEAD